DGFVAYLNGNPTVVAAANNPGTLNNTSGASGSHSDSLAVGYVAFPITGHIGKLQVGTNILAIHALNNGTGSSDLLITPQITYSDAPGSGGGLSPSAIQYTAPITLPASGTITVRSVNNGTWTALNEATFYIEDLARTDDLRIAELNYHPPGDAPLEFIEIVNTAAYPVNLEGCVLSDGVSHTFGNHRLDPGTRIVLAGDLTEFQNHYGFPAHAGFTGSLNNDGETVTLLTASGETIDSFTYNDANSWPRRADGGGSSLEISANTLPSDAGSSWRSSSEYGGSPGTAGTGPDRRVIINEILAHTDLPQRDTIELFNNTASAIDISGWFLTDNNNVYKSFRIPTGTPPVPAGGYLTFDESAFNPLPTGSIQNYTGTPAAPPLTVQSNAHGLSDGDTVTIAGYAGAPAYNDTFEITVINANTFTVPTPFLDNHATRGSWATGRPFALSASKGDKLWLLESDPDGTLISFVDNAGFPASVNGGTLGRYPNGEHNGPLYPLTVNSLGSINQTARHGPVVITEIMYNPLANPDDNLEFVEIANTGDSLEPLDHWRLRGGVDFDFGPSHSIAPGQVLVLVGFDPN
ncbi:MAG: lamin tail domain-containing protein, partial [Verrucomicrobiales bacterium]|nr:lamin tail domain-containing protein [Verrucomicrobiales bacterium]